MMSESEVQGLVGLAVAEARRQVESKGWQFRILGEDGVHYPSTTDLRDDRVNVMVTAGKIESADIG
jgi:hypothetical protein